MEFKTISLEDIEFGDNPRLTFMDDSLEELSASLKRDGLIEPIIVKPNGLKYELIIGERRVRAAIRANMPKLPAIVRDDITDEEASRLRLVENINRKDLNVFERVNGIKAHMEKYGQTLEQMAEELGKKPETVKGWIRLTETTSPEIKSVDRFVRELGTQKLMEISKYNFETQERLAEKIITNGLTVDQVRRFIKLFESNPEADLDTLIMKVKEQVKTIEVTLPIEEAEKVLKRAKELRKREKKAEKKLKKHLRRNVKTQTTVLTKSSAPGESSTLAEPSVTTQQNASVEPRVSKPQLTTSVDIPIELPSIKKLRETEIAKLAEKEKFTANEVQRLKELDRSNPELLPKELIEMIKRQMRPQIMVVEIPSKLYSALEIYSNSERVFPKEAVLMLIEEGLESHVYMMRGK